MFNSHKILTEEDQSLLQENGVTHEVQRVDVSAEKDEIQDENKQQHEQKQSHSRSDLIGLVTHQIQTQIESSQITISNQQVIFLSFQKPFALNEHSSPSAILKNDSQKYDVSKVAQIVKKRKDLEEQIKRLKLEQQQERKKSRSKSPLDKAHKTFRSNFTSQQHLEISRIMKKSEKFENQIQYKDKELAQALQAQKIKQNQDQRIYLQKLKEKKKQEALKKIQQMEQEKRQRNQKLKQENKKFQEVKKIKALHQKIEEHDKLFEEQKREQQIQLLRQKRQSMTFNFAEIRDHEKKYYETVRMSKQKIESQMMEKIQKMKEDQVLLSQTYRPSKFLLTLKNEQKQKEEIEQERIQRLKSLYTKKTHFQEELRSIHKEKIKTKPKPQMKKSILDEKLDEHRLKVKSMSAADIYKQGQEYMRSAHKSITPSLIEQTKSELQRNYSELKNGLRPQYRDYLQEQKMRKEIQLKSMGKDKQNPEIHELESLIDRKKDHASVKLEKAKMIAEKLDRKAKNSSTNALIDSISAKLKIIEEFS